MRWISLDAISRRQGIYVGAKSTSGLGHLDNDPESAYDTSSRYMDHI